MSIEYLYPQIKSMREQGLNYEKDQRVRNYGNMLN